VLCEVVLNLKRKNLFFFLDLLSAVAKALGMYYFSDRYRQRVGSYKRKIFFRNYLPHAHIYQKKQHIVKTSAATLNQSKKRKRFFLFLDLKRHR
jgi:hypothetical protein